MSATQHELREHKTSAQAKSLHTTGRSDRLGATVVPGGTNFSLYLEYPREIIGWKAAPPVPGPTYQAGPRSVVVMIAGLELQNHLQKQS